MRQGPRKTTQYTNPQAAANNLCNATLNLAGCGGQPLRHSTHARWMWRTLQQPNTLPRAGCGGLPKRKRRS